MSFTYLDFFAGVGGFRSGFDSIGAKCLGFAEIDKNARNSYKAIHDTAGEIEWHDITKVTDDEFLGLSDKVDLINAGFPCQAFSLSGKRRGFADSRGTLFYEVARAAKFIRPKYLLLENVKGLLSHDKGNTINVIFDTLNEIGYTFDFTIANSKYFGVPQNRERVFILAVRGDLIESEKWNVSPNKSVQRVKERFIKESDVKTINFFDWNYDLTHVSTELKQVLQDSVDSKYTVDQSRIDEMIKIKSDHVLVREATKKGYAEAYPLDSINMAQPKSKTRRGRVGKKIANTLLTGVEQAVLLDDMSIRFLTPLESWRLQGFSDDQFNKAKEAGTKESQLYKQAGNGVTINVIAKIAGHLQELNQKIDKNTLVNT